jgi:hypothetical protein
MSEHDGAERTPSTVGWDTLLGALEKASERNDSAAMADLTGRLIATHLQESADPTKLSVLSELLTDQVVDSERAAAIGISVVKALLNQQPDPTAADRGTFVYDSKSGEKIFVPHAKK